MLAASTGSTPGANTAGKAAPADRHEDRGGTSVTLLFDLASDRALTGDHIRVGKRMHELEPVLFGQPDSVRVRVVVGLSMQDDLAAKRSDGLGLDRCRALGHHDQRPDPQPSCCQGNALGVIAGRTADDALAEACGGDVGQTILRSAALERKDRLQVFPLQEDLVIQSP
jgi:hypothetical protein